MLSTRVCTPCARCDHHALQVSEEFARSFIGGGYDLVTTRVPTCCSRCQQGLGDYLYGLFWGLFSADEWNACPSFGSSLYNSLYSLFSDEPTTTARTMYIPATLFASLPLVYSDIARCFPVLCCCAGGKDTGACVHLAAALEFRAQRCMYS